jgi:hypothetical protein
MGTRVIIKSKLKQQSVGDSNELLVFNNLPETKRSFLGHDEGYDWRSELLAVARALDDLRKVVKCQPSFE